MAFADLFNRGINRRQQELESLAAGEDQSSSLSPNAGEYDQWGELQTPIKYDVTKPGYDPELDKGFDVESALSAMGPKRQPLTGKPRPLSRMELQALEGGEKSIANKKEIEKLLADYEAASERSKGSNLAAGISEAGMEFGRAFGGQSVDKDFIKGVRERGQAGMKKVKEKQDLGLKGRKDFRDQASADQDLMQGAQQMDETGLNIEKKQMGISNEKDLLDEMSNDSKLARQMLNERGMDVPDSFSAKDIFNNEMLLKQDFEARKAAEHEKASTGRARIIAGASIQRGREAGAAGIAKALITAENKENIASLRGDVRNMKIAERMIPGLRMIKSEEGWIPSAQASQSARKTEAVWGTMAPMMASAISMLRRNGRNVLGTDAWNILKSKYASIAQNMNKLDENGVMNYADMDNILTAIGDPNSLNQWLNEGGLVRLEESLKNSKIKRDAHIRAYGYEPGEQSLSETQAIGAGSGGSGRQGRDLRPTGENVDVMLGAAGLPPIQMGKKTATANGPQAPVEEPAQKLQVLEETQSFIKYKDPGLKKGFRIVRKGM